MADIRPENCRNRLRDEGKPYPKSGCAYCKNGGLMGCQFDKAKPRIKSQDEITEDRIRAINSRLDVQDQVISRLIELLINLDVCYYRDVEEIIAMLEESQNPFSEAKDESAD